MDYAIINVSLQKNIKKFKVLLPSYGSDHCPLNLEVTYKPTTGHKKDKLSTIKPKIMWNENAKNIFDWHMNSAEMLSEIENLEEIINKQEKGVDIAAEKIRNIFIKALGAKSQETKPRHSKIKPKKWYDKSCQELSKTLKLTAYLLNKNPRDPFLRGRMITVRKEYKKLLKHKKSQYHAELVNKLEKAEENNPKEYWKLIKMLRDQKKEQSICNTEDFVNFFENLFSEKNTPSQEEKDMEISVESILKNAEGKADFTM